MAALIERAAQSNLRLYRNQHTLPRDFLSGTTPGRKERPEQPRHGPASRLSWAVEQQLRSALRQQPDLTLGEMQRRLAERVGIRISRSRLWVWLQRLGLRKKIAPGARTRQRGEPRAAASLVVPGKRVGPRCLVFLDESDGCHMDRYNSFIVNDL